MPDDKKKFTLKESDRMISDVIEEYFNKFNINYDYKELMKDQLLGENVPEGYHRMPSGELMLDSEMPQGGQ